MKQADEKKQDKKQGNKQAIMPTESVEGLHIGERPRRNHKDSTFCLLFSEPERAIELYNAVTGENLPPDTELTYKIGRAHV